MTLEKLNVLEQQEKAGRKRFVGQDKKELEFNEWKTCKKCELIGNLMGMVTSSRGYWLCTELFVELHNGKDYCR